MFALRGWDSIVVGNSISNSSRLYRSILRCVGGLLFVSGWFVVEAPVRLLCRWDLVTERFLGTCNAEKGGRFQSPLLKYYSTSAIEIVAAEDAVYMAHSFDAWRSTQRSTEPRLDSSNYDSNLHYCSSRSSWYGTHFIILHAKNLYRNGKYTMLRRAPGSDGERKLVFIFLRKSRNPVVLGSCLVRLYLRLHRRALERLRLRWRIVRS